MPMRKTFVNDSTGENTFTPVDEGTYLVEVIQIGEKEDKNGYPFWGVRLKVVAGPMDKPNPEWVGKLVFDNWFMSPDPTLENQLVHRLRAFGCQVSKGDDFEMLEADFVGKQCLIDVHHETYQGKVNAKPDQFGYSKVEPEVAEATKASVAKAVATNLEAEQGSIPF
jgi:hypothetical protein